MAWEMVLFKTLGEKEMLLSEAPSFLLILSEDLASCLIYKKAWGEIQYEAQAS